MHQKIRNTLVGAAAVACVLLSGALFVDKTSWHAPTLPQQLNALTPSTGEAPVKVALHRALYDFKMVSVETGSGILGVKGKMFFEQDDACDAWTTDHRYTIEYTYPERSSVYNTNHYSSWEAKTGDQFQFTSERQENSQTIEKLRGSITPLPDGTARAEYTKPDNIVYALPKGYLLPTSHTNELLRRAKAGEHFFSAVMFDGSDADGPVETSIFIGKKVSPDEIAKLVADNPKIDKTLLTPDAWHIRMAAFALKDTQESSPVYEMDMTLHDNGVISHALVDYKTFKIEQILTALEAIPLNACTSTP